MTPHVSNRFILFAATPIYAPGLIRLFLSSIPKRAIHLTFRTHYIFFADGKQIVSRDSSGNRTVSFFYTKGWKMESLYGPAPNLMCSPLPPGSSAGLWRDLQSHRRNLSSRQSHLNIRHDVCAKSRNFQLLFTMKKAVY